VLQLRGTEPGEGLVGSELGKAEGVEVLSGSGGTTEGLKVSGKGSGDLFDIERMEVGRCE